LLTRTFLEQSSVQLESRIPTIGGLAWGYSDY
jgi:hypothetical protein